ncbi:MAG: Holliday junction resolvase RuvX [Pseudomonadales bacterium]|nr:Holliday junction resolvase RuvX [Pseudomonadales bacterium]
MNSNIINVLAIDYGTVRIGLAISRHTLAEPLMIVANDKFKFSKIKEVCENNHIKKIIIGISENTMAIKTEHFVLELKKYLKANWSSQVSIEYMDETLSSNSVHQKLRTAKKSKREAPIDHYAAAEFLQEWLDLHY